jgi:hypothetical protein
MAILRVLGYLYATTDCIDVQGYSRGFLPESELDAYMVDSFAGDIGALQIMWYKKKMGYQRTTFFECIVC